MAKQVDNTGKDGYWWTTETSHEWIDDICSLCGFVTDAFSKLRECPNCHARMKTYSEYLAEEQKGAQNG